MSSRTRAIAVAMMIVSAAGGWWFGRAGMSQPTHSTAAQATGAGAAAGVQPDANKAADAATTGGANKPDGQANASNEAPSLWVRNIVALATALLTLPVIVAIAALVFKKQVGAAFDALVKALSERGGTIDATIFKVTLQERPVEATDDTRPVSLLSLFDITDDPIRSANADVQSIAPQLKFGVSDRVARHWELMPGHAHEVPAMRAAFEELRAACTSEASYAAIQHPLRKYVRALETCRYRDARALAALLDECAVLRREVLHLQPSDLARDADDFALLHAVGVAYGQDNSRWSEAFAVLNRIAWNGDAVLYARAGTHWVAAAYHEVLKKYEADIGRTIVSRAVIDEVQAVYDRGIVLLGALETWDGRGAALPHGYYLREIHKDLGSVLSVFAAHIADRVSRQRFLDLAVRHYEATVQVLPGGETPSPLDHNNIAHFYRQRGDVARTAADDLPGARECYQKAHEQIQQAFEGERPSDPAYHDTLALLLLAEGKTFAAYQALTEHTIEQVRARPPEELGSYFENQILAAKLLLRANNGQPAVGRACAVQTLQRAIGELGELRHALEDEEARGLEAQMQELVGFLHLDAPVDATAAVSAFERLLTLRSSDATRLEKVRANTGAALALVLAARARRRESSPGASEALRTKAAVSVDAALEAFTAPVLPPEARLAAIQGAQLLIEERCVAHEDEDAATLAKRIAGHLSLLRDEIDTKETAPSDSLKMLRRLMARHAIVSARLQIRACAANVEASEIQKIEALLLPARAIAQFSCEADLELGVLRLNAARVGGEGAMAHWQAAIEAFERANQADVPAMRSEVFRLVSNAYAMRGAILRKVPAAAPQKTET